jgi:signal transduction histidine kinase
MCYYHERVYPDNALTAFQSLARRQFLRTAWPWRSSGYLLMTPLAVMAASVPLALLAVPWLFLLHRLRAGDDQLAPLVLLFLSGAALLAAAGPLAAMPLAAAERLRLRLVDSRPAGSQHRPPPRPGAWPWLRIRYAEGATWRELGYAVLLVTAIPALYAAVLAIPAYICLLAVSPLVVRAAGDHPVTLGFAQVTTVGQALPYAVAGLALLAVIPYLLALLAGIHGALARLLLTGDSGAGLRAELAQVARSRARLADAFEAERRRIERDLHDGAQQYLVSLTLQLGLARLELPGGSPGAAQVTTAHEQAKQLMAMLRELIHGIHPRVLADHGLPAALRELADQSSVPVTVQVGLPRRLPGPVESVAYFVVAEALTNMTRHSGATAATVTAHHGRGLLVVEVSDNGHGGADPAAGSGLTGLADRVAAVSGRMLLSSPPGGPTLLRVELPCR